MALIRVWRDAPRVSYHRRRFFARKTNFISETIDWKVDTRSSWELRLEIFRQGIFRDLTSQLIYFWPANSKQFPSCIYEYNLVFWQAQRSLVRKVSTGRWCKLLPKVAWPVAKHTFLESLWIELSNEAWHRPRPRSYPKFDASKINTTELTLPFTKWLNGVMVRALMYGAAGWGFDPHPRKLFYFFFFL